MSSITFSGPEYAKVNIKHIKGDKLTKSFSVNYGVNAYNMADLTLVMHIKTSLSGSISPVQTLSSASGDLVISGTSSNIVTFNEVIDLAPGVYYYDIEVQENNKTIMQGTITIYPEVTDLIA